MADPKSTMQPDPQPPQGGPPLIPVKSIHFPVGFKLDLPGVSRGGYRGSLAATAPGKSDYWSIMYDPRLRHHVVAHFKPGPDLKRPPADTLCIPENMVTWRRA